MGVRLGRGGRVDRRGRPGKGRVHVRDTVRKRREGVQVGGVRVSKEEGMGVSLAWNRERKGRGSSECSEGHGKGITRV